MDSKTTQARIQYPTAEDLDIESSYWEYGLYLDPTVTPPAVRIHGGAGNIGRPMMAHNGHWVAIMGYQGPAVGQSVLDVLVQLEDELVAVAECYEGESYDGNNYVGDWSDGQGDAVLDLECAAQKYRCEIRKYWPCDGWMAGGGQDWVSTCEWVGLDPDIAAQNVNDIDELEREIVAAASHEGVDVIFVREWLEWAAREHLRGASDDA